MKHLDLFVEALTKLKPAQFNVDGDPQDQPPVINHLNDSILAGEYYNLSVSEEETDENYFARFDKALGDNVGSLLENLINSAKRERALLSSGEGQATQGGGASASAVESLAKADAERMVGNIQVFNSYIQRSVEQYRKFAGLVKKNLEEFGVRPMVSFTLNQSMENQFLSLEVAMPDEGKEQSEMAELYRLFMLNLCLAELDESLSCEENVRRRLDKYIHFLASYNPTDATRNLVHILLGKARYLHYKVEYRGYLCDRNQKAECEEPPVQSMEAFSYFLAGSTDHHGRADGTAKAPMATLNLGELHKWNRVVRKKAHLPDTKPFELEAYRTEAEGLLPLLKTKWSGATERRFEYVAYGSAYNLVFNTRIELLLQEERRREFRTIQEQLTVGASTADFNLAFVTERIREIKAHQNEVKIMDYHPFQSLLQFLNDFLAKARMDPLKLVINREKMDAQTEAQTIALVDARGKYARELFQQIFLLFRARLRWCREHHYNPVYLSVAECRPKELFLDSAYILPDHFKRLDQKWEGAEAKAEIEIRIIEDLMKVETHRAVTENAFETKRKEVEDTLRKNEFRTVQIVAMFVSIATFVLSQVEIFEGRDVAESLSILFAFSAALLLFNAFFKWIINGSLVVAEEKGTWKFYPADEVLVGLIVLFGVLSFAIAHVDAAANANELRRLRTEVDSLKAQRFVFDSTATPTSPQPGTAGLAPASTLSNQ